ncbi:MAG TPA: hypothetical protein VHX88_07425, partial [Solirubrobacteraceae bacterium]|nr:hypothetical protein [Solirubrobacteraceae bacterium]
MESTARTEADIEELEGEPVPDGAGALPAAPAGPRLPVRASVPPGAQVVAVAAGGFIAGAATVALARRHQRRAALARR